MRVLVLYAHPVPESFGAAVHEAVVEALKQAGHEVDDCDLYAEGIDPVLGPDERRGYHDTASNTLPVAGYVERVRAAEALVLCFPVWNFGYPAMLKGFFDRVFLPGVSFDLADGKVTPTLGNIRKLAAVTTYGASRWTAFLMGNPPRRLVCRALRAVCHPLARTLYLAHYDMNRATPESRAAFLKKVAAKVAVF